MNKDEEIDKAIGEIGDIILKLNDSLIALIDAMEIERQKPIPENVLYLNKVK